MSDMKSISNGVIIIIQVKPEQAEQGPHTNTHISLHGLSLGGAETREESSIYFV